MTSSSSSLKAPCTRCGSKAAGIFRCEGCLQVFCRKHLNEHRDLLSRQLDEIVIEHDTLQQTIEENKDNQNNQHPILKQIDKWEEDSIVKIQQVAEEARQQVNKLTSSQTVSEELHDLAERLQKARIDDDYVETDLRTWTTMLQTLKDNINTYSPSISIQEDQTEILIGKMYVSTIPAQHSRQHERFGESIGDISLDNNSRLATHCSSKNSDAWVRGIGEYSSKKHYIRFLLKKRGTRYITSFGVVSKLMSRSEEKTGYAAYGWASDDTIGCPDIVMTVDKNFWDMNGRTIFEIELELDCDNRKISYVNLGTNKRREMNVDITQCPFPWQIEFYLYEVQDWVQFPT